MIIRRGTPVWRGGGTHSPGSQSADTTFTRIGLSIDEWIIGSSVRLGTKTRLFVKPCIALLNGVFEESDAHKGRLCRLCLFTILILLILAAPFELVDSKETSMNNDESEHD